VHGAQQCICGALLLVLWNHLESPKFHGGTSQVTSSKSDGNAEQTLNARGFLLCSRYHGMHLHQNAFNGCVQINAAHRVSIGEHNAEPQEASDSCYKSSMLPPSGSNEWPFWVQLLCVGEELIPVCGNEFLLPYLRAKLLLTMLVT